MKSFNEWCKKKNETQSNLNEIFGLFKKKEIVCELCGEIHQLDKKTGEPIVQQIFTPLKIFAHKKSATPWLKDAKGHEFIVVAGEKTPRYDDALSLYNTAASSLREIEMERKWRELKEKERKAQEELDSKIKGEFGVPKAINPQIWGSLSSQDNATRNKGRYGY